MHRLDNLRNATMLPDLDSLVLFVRAAEMKNLTRASEACLITAPAASRRLALLEHQFKASLFERHSRGLDLTPAGERLLSMAREVIAGVQHMRSEMGNYARGPTSVLRVQGNTSAMTQALLGDIAAFQRENEDVRLVLGEAWSDDSLRRLRAGDADISVVVQGVDAAGLHTLPYRQDQLAAVLRQGDLLGARQPLGFADLLERDIVGLESGSALTRLLAQEAARLLRAMAMRVQVRSFEAVCRAVEAGLGVGVLPVAATRSFATGMGLQVLPLADDWARRRMILCMRAEPEPGSALARLANHLHGLAD